MYLDWKVLFFMVYLFMYPKLIEVAVIMICLKKMLFVVVSMVAIRAQAMDDLFQEKRVASQEVSSADTRDMKRHKHDEDTQPVLTHDQFILFLTTFSSFYSTLHWRHAGQKSRLDHIIIDQEDDLIENIRQMLLMFIEEPLPLFSKGDDLGNVLGKT